MFKSVDISFYVSSALFDENVKNDDIMLIVLFPEPSALYPTTAILEI